jgi:DNA-binding MarR family transcriptional regulator
MERDHSGGAEEEDDREQMARKLRQGRSRQSANRGASLDSPLRESPSFLVRLAQLGAFDEFHRHFAGLGVTPARFSAFALIVTNPGVRPGVLSEELRVKPSNIAALVNALVADGLVERQQDKSELRANQLRPTKAGTKAFQEMWDIHCHLDKLLLEPLTASERKLFVTLMQKIDRV